MGFGLGILAAPAMIAHFGIPNTFLGILMVAVPCAIIVAAAIYLLVGRISTDMDSMVKIEQQQMQRRWAWLKPAGLALRSPHPVNKSQVVIGRDIKCDILLLNDSISRRHAEIVREGLGWRIRDLGSNNGTFVNGKNVKDALLNEGDSITLGDLSSTFEGPAEPMPADMTPESMNFSPDPEAVMDFDSTAVHRLNPAGTGTQAMGTPSSMQRTEVMTSGTKIC